MLLLVFGALGPVCCSSARGAAADDTHSGPAAASTPDHLKVEYRVNFRDSGYDSWLSVEPHNELASLVQQNHDGLRIAVPPKTEGRNVGVFTRFGVHGDFEITASYEVLAIKPPEKGGSVGPELYVRSDKGWGDFVAMARYLRKGQEGPVIASIQGRKIDGKPNYHGLDVKALDKKGKFRIVRNGPMVHFFVAEGKDDQFRQVSETEFGTNDIDMVRLAAIFGSSEHQLDILWHELTIRAEALPGWIDRKSLGGQWTFFLWMDGLVILVIVVALLGYHRWRKTHPLESEQHPSTD